MTHPDITRVEIFGEIHSEKNCKIGECLYCESVIYDNSSDIIESTDGLFCDMDCCCEYYEITPFYN